jgi:hypothetical protein
VAGGIGIGTFYVNIVEANNLLGNLTTYGPAPTIGSTETTCTFASGTANSISIGAVTAQTSSNTNYNAKDVFLCVGTASGNELCGSLSNSTLTCGAAGMSTSDTCQIGTTATLCGVASQTACVTTLPSKSSASIGPPLKDLTNTEVTIGYGTIGVSNSFGQVFSGFTIGANPTPGSTTPIANAPNVGLWIRTCQEGCTIDRVGIQGPFGGYLTTSTGGAALVYMSTGSNTIMRSNLIASLNTAAGSNEIDNVVLDTRLPGNGIINTSIYSTTMNSRTSTSVTTANLIVNGPSNNVACFECHFENGQGGDNVLVENGATFQAYGGAALPYAGKVVLHIASTGASIGTSIQGMLLVSNTTHAVWQDDTQGTSQSVPGLSTFSYRQNVQAGTANIYGLLQTAASTTSSAGVNIPAGTAPTAPNNGDLWSTTSGFFGRVNGGTVGPFGNGSVFPITVSGTVTSGGIPYFSSTTNEATSALLATNAIVQGGGAGGAPTTGNGDFTVDATAHTLKSGASGLVDFSAITGANGLLLPAAVAGTTLNGTVTANLSSPIVLKNTNSTNNNTSIGVGITTPGSSTGQTTLNINGAATGGDLTDWGTGGTWTSGVLSGQTIAASVNISGAFVSKGTTAGFVALSQGPTSASIAPCNSANTHCIQAGTSTTSGVETDAPALAQGVPTRVGNSSAVTDGYTGDSNHSATVSWSTATSVSSTSLCSTTYCPAGNYQVSGYIDVTTACTTTGSYVVNLIYTDDTTVSKTVVVPFFGLGYTTTFGPTAVTSTLVPTATTDYGSIVPFTIHSTGATSINYSSTAGACGTGGPGVGKLYLVVEPIS